MYYVPASVRASNFSIMVCVRESDFFGLLMLPFFVSPPFWWCISEICLRVALNHNNEAKAHFQKAIK